MTKEKFESMVDLSVRCGFGYDPDIIRILSKIPDDILEDILAAGGTEELSDVLDAAVVTGKIPGKSPVETCKKRLPGFGARFYDSARLAAIIAGTLFPVIA